MTIHAATPSVSQGSAACVKSRAVDWDQHYRSFDLKTFGLGAGKELVYSSVNGSAHVVPKEWVSVIRACNRFASLREHADRLSANAQIPALQSVLSSAVQFGLLISKNDVLSLLQAGPNRLDQSFFIDVMCFPTRDRVDVLERGLTSYIRNTKHYGRSVSFVVADDSRSRAAQELCRDMLRKLSRLHAVEIRYAGQLEKSRFAHRLAVESGVSEQEIRFALINEDEFSFSPGASRNALLLETIGRAVVQVDDDSVCSLVAAPEQRPGITLRGEGDSTELWFFPNREETIRSNQFVDKDFLSLHECVLGKDITGFLSGGGSESLVELDAVNAHFLTAHQDAGNIVLASSLGVVGDSGMEREVYALIGPSSLDRLTASIERYRGALASREVLRVAPQLTIAMRTTCMGGNLGLDNRKFLPPFIPVQRGEDTVFSVILAACFSGACIGFLPWALLHDPPRRNLSPADRSAKIAHLRTNDFVSLIIASLESALYCRGQQQRLQALGQHLIDVSELPESAFIEFMRDKAWRAISGYLQLLEQRLRQRGSQPEYWASDVWRSIDALRRAPTLESCGVPADLLISNSIDQARRLFKTTMLRYGMLLKSWPAIMDAAKLLRTKGETLAEAL